MKNVCYTFGVLFLACANPVFGSEAGMPQLNPEFWIAQIFWLIITFATLYLIIWKIFLPKIRYSIESRKSRIVNDLDEAQKLGEAAEKKLMEYNEIIEQSKKEAKKIIDDNKKKLDKDIENKKKEFDKEIEKELASTEKELKNLKSKSLPSIIDVASEISEEIIKQIINTEVNKSNVSAIVNEITKKEVEKNI